MAAEDPMDLHPCIDIRTKFLDTGRRSGSYDASISGQASPNFLRRSSIASQKV